MKKPSVTFIALMLSLGVLGALQATQGNGLRAQDSPSAESYYPPSELAGGWRRYKTDEEVRKLGGMDPGKLARVGRMNLTFYGGPWQLLVIRHGYLVREARRTPAPLADRRLLQCLYSAAGLRPVRGA